MGFIIYLLVAVVMFGIGIYQIKSKNPVGFYSGEKPPKKEDLTDVSAWNKYHGFMWITYGIIIIVCYLIGEGIMIAEKANETLWCLIPMMGGVIIPIPIMIYLHHKMIKKYMK